jgi:hypothetical protein
MRHRLAKQFPLVLALLLSSVEFALAGSQKDEKAIIEEFRAFAKEEAARYNFRLEDSDRPLRFRPESVLSYMNPVVGGVYGDVFIWTADGRPEVVGAIYRFYNQDPHRGDALQSLSLRKVIGEREGAVVWSPTKPGLEFKPIPGAPAPADSSAGRLRQMRAMAQEFSSRQTTRAGIDSAMRLLTQPIYRYEDTKGDLIDGGLFVFVQGTAPEIFLLIEARRTGNGAAEWRFGATRMHGIDLRLYRQGKLVWRAPEIPWSQIIDPREPFWGFRVEMPRQR